VSTASDSFPTENEATPSSARPGVARLDVSELPWRGFEASVGYRRPVGYDDDRDWFEIELIQGRWAKVSIADMELVLGYCWYVNAQRYAVRTNPNHGPRDSHATCDPGTGQ
jgi:hypothetical protein